jgi:hypothetical protein
MLDAEFLPEPGEVVGRHRVRRVGRVAGVVFLVLEPDDEVAPAACAATSDWPWLSTYCRSTSISVSWRSTPSIIAATSEEEHRRSREWMHTDPRSTCQ